MSLAAGNPVAGGQQLQQSPAISELVEKASGEVTPQPGDHIDAESTSHPDGKHKKRSLFGFGKKKDETTDAKTQAPTTAPASAAAPGSSATRPPPLHSESSKVSTTTRSTGSPTRSEFPSMMPASPGRAFTGSPRVASPAGSQIFERDVDTVTALKPQSPAIPNHIQTENHIPSVLDASSEAITNERLDPDSVEIVTHAQHQPASVAVPGAAPASSSQPSYEQLAASWAEELGALGDRDPDSISNYAALDATDIRRLSFISFADVVQAEHTGGPAASRESIHIAGLTSLSANRSPSPVLSPMSSPEAVGTSPPTSNPGSIKGIELSPARKTVGGAGSPISISTHHPISNGEINIETMSQALRRTASNDFGAVRSFPVSPTEGPSR
ncbi:hypothetical protein F5X68DRAFT_203321 [Plectosphaerella plurivora]|uniref:Uncharacterized protein n=1 Tax=Plectosphaerella plurivora TaxID=936078 RepID=A0A9P8VH70_9PEZI|nr:hypothetical protein F5X68DRAFT_203321 [Plectosphaerella plurivora]